MCLSDEAEGVLENLIDKYGQETDNEENGMNWKVITCFVVALDVTTFIVFCNSYKFYSSINAWFWSIFTCRHSD